MHTRDILVLLGLVAAGIASLLLPPPGLLALALGTACLVPWPGRTRRVWGIAGFLLLLLAVPTNLALGGQLDGHLMLRGDFQTYIVGAEVGVRHGWSQLFDVGLQRAEWARSAGAGVRFLPFLNTPPQAWLVAPLTALPYTWAYAAWVTLMVTATAAVVYLVAPATARARIAAGLMVAAAWVAVYSLASGQNAVIGALAIAVCWRLIRAGHRGWAGLALALIILRPNAAFLVPLALLLAGERQVFGAWLAASLALGAVILLSLGIHGVQQFASLAVEVRRDFPRAVELTLQQELGPGLLTVGLQVLLAAVALLAAARLGHGRPAVAIAAGVVGSAFLTPYIHLQDFLTLLAAAAILVTSRERPRAGWVLVALLVVAPPGWLFGDRWPYAVLVVELGWLAWTAWPMHPGQHRSSPGPASRPVPGTGVY